MNVIIWDLDYYYAKNKVNCFNPDVMKISSYHKQLGDKVSLVTTEFDIKRAFDLFYIIKNNEKLPHPPKEFFLNPKVRWWGKAYEFKVRWKMTDAMLGCRPDYLIYPEHNTAVERSEQVRLFNNKAELLPLTQDWSNTYKNKFTIVTDTCMWYSDSKSIIVALKMLQEVKKVSFFEPIWLQKILSDKLIEDEFLKLNFSPGSKISWTVIKLEWIDKAIEFIKRFKEKFPNVASGEVVVDWKGKSHWEDRQNALDDYEMLRRLICRCKDEGFKFSLRMPETRFETPYFEIFEELGAWTAADFQVSWIEWISKRYGNKVGEDARIYWNRPNTWHELFRDLLRQSWFDKEFVVKQWKEREISANEVPWNIWKEEFENGIGI